MSDDATGGNEPVSIIGTYLASFVALGAGAWMLADGAGVSVSAVFASTQMGVGVAAVLASYILIFTAHKQELLAAREGREWWLKERDSDE